jgi:N-methylhydantoinase A
MGGTSFDVGLIVDGQPILATSREVGRFHVALPAIKVTAIGAGGGSIARVRGGHLTVGPDSAGAEPGPVCFGRGGTDPTITDADVVLGIIDPNYFLGGEMKLDAGLAEAAIMEHIGKPLGYDLHEAAAGIREVANNQMADLLRRVTTRSGYDPRGFAIFAYGGAGPTHAHLYGSIAGISTAVVPTTASGHSALGAVTADRHRSFSVAFGHHAPPRFKNASDHVDVQGMNEGFARLDQLCRAALGEDAQIDHLVTMRFRFQVHEIPVEAPNKQLTPAELDALVERFVERYEQIYGKNTALRGTGVEFNVLRAEAVSPVQKPVLSLLPKRDVAPEPLSNRKVYFYRLGFKETPVYRSENLGPGTVLRGPVIVERPDTTILVGINQSLEVEPYGNFILRLSESGIQSHV